MNAREPLRILVSNDDGIAAPGLHALASAFGDLGRVVVVAPSRERSTTSHSLTLHKPLRVASLSEDRFAVSGSPADCLYLGANSLMDPEPNLVLSGINRGANLGTDIHYSGTVAAARGGAMLGLKSFAFSLVSTRDLDASRAGREMDFEMAGRIARRVVDQTMDLEFLPHTLLNVNIPNLPEDEIKGIRVTRQGFRHYSRLVDIKHDPRNHPYYWIAGAYVGFEPGEDTDCHAIDSGFVSVTPLTIDATDSGFLGLLRQTSFTL